MPSRKPLTATRTIAPDPSHPNLGPAQRLFSISTGIALVINGLRRPGPGGLAQVALGLAASWRGYTGVCKLTHALDHTAYEHFMQHDSDWQSSKAVSRSVTVNRPREEVFAFFADPQNLARLLPWIDAVEILDAHSARWTAKGPMGKALSWTLQQVTIHPNEALQWDTVYQGPWKHRIEASFRDAPQGRGTEIKLVLACEPYPGSAAYALASAIARFTDRAVLNLLRQVKQTLETGEVATNQMRTASVVPFPKALLVTQGSEPNPGPTPATEPAGHAPGTEPPTPPLEASKAPGADVAGVDRLQQEDN